MKVTKGEKTKKIILEKALDIASLAGLTNISIGDIAKVTKLSRSGLFAHFQSKEQMQLDILKYAEEKFLEIVIKPTELETQPLEKFKKLQELWPNWFDRTDFKIRGGCIFIMAIMEYDDRPGVVRDALLDQQNRLVKYIEKIAKVCVKNSDFNEQTNTSQFAFEYYSYYLGYSIHKKFLDDTKAQKKFKTSIESLISRHLKN